MSGRTIALFGLGYVGTVSGACLAARGQTVIGVDLDRGKVDAINAGRSPVIERDLDDLVRQGIASGRLRATTDGAAAVRAADLSMICVGTPSRENGGLDTDHVEKVTREIGRALQGGADYHLVVFRSTMLPGTVEGRLLPILAEASGRRPGADLGVAVNPEFLREGTSVRDFHEPPRTVIGALDQRSGDLLEGLYDGLPGPRVRTTIRTAEMVKYADNCFHALKVAFGNEIGNLCKREGIDSHALMDIFCLDRKLNLSPAYLKGAYAFGGSCLPKDLRAIVHHARARDLEVPLLNAILESNEQQKKIGLQMILRTRRKKVGLLGLSFKPGTDDLRESPAVELAEALIGKGFEVSIYDRNVSLARLVGANRAYIEREIPHIANLMRASLDEIRAQAEVIVVTTSDPEFATFLPTLRPDQAVIDLARLGSQETPAEYAGICW
ncbi:MAG TPA: UDP-glucose/GDP-mannose dehydrogenase family protein [Candidatus Polarisedimenticolia bacterium]|nr:UDP-glucose/GDP-mannose dehydrogenase family protein [Candidatus Polarisedimenticolia bacterium]